MEVGSSHKGWAESFDYPVGHQGILAVVVVGGAAAAAAEVAAVEPGSAAVAAGFGYSDWRDTAAPTPGYGPAGYRRQCQQR